MEADKKRRNYKLLVDPMLRGGSTKIYRFEGVDPTVRKLRKHDLLRAIICKQNITIQRAHIFSLNI